MTDLSVQSAPAVSDDRLEGGAGQRAEWSTRSAEDRFASWDGTELFYRVWRPAGPSDRAMFLFHRGHEHSERWQEFVEALAPRDCWVFARDARGHGRSPGERGYAENLSCIVRDLDAFVRFACERHQLRIENSVVVGHSVGAVVAATWVHDYAPPIRGIVLLTPALRVKLYVPLAIPSLRVLNRVRGKAYVKSYVSGRMLTHDREEARRYDSDPLISRQIAVNILLDLHDTSKRLIADAGAIAVPTLVLAAGSDRVVRVSAQRRFCERLSSSIKRFEVFDGCYHDLVHETNRGEVIDRIRSFLAELPDGAPSEARAAAVDRLASYTSAEHARLEAPLPALSPRGLKWGMLKLLLKTGGRLSQGIRLGWTAGFDSGASLDYVYENAARGIPPLGRWSDRMYLNSPGWRGVRIRRANLERLLRRAMAKLSDESRPVHILDIAAGAGRYVIETLAAARCDGASAVLRDSNPDNLEAARRLAKAMDVSNVTVQAADAFDPRSYESMSPRPTVAVVSGLYELFPDNQRVCRSLAALACAVEPGGYLIYTNQPWHPQIELIARTLINREGRPWVMRRRTQAEMDFLVRQAGFEKLAQETDPWGIFTVSLARRIGD